MPPRRTCVAAATGETLAFVDSDCRAEPEWLARGIEALARSDVVGGRVDVLVKEPGRITATEAFERVFAFNIEQYVTRKGFVGSGNLFCRRTTFDVVGPFGN